MAYFGPKDLMLEIAKGNVPGHYGVNKFGQAPDGVQQTITDIWDLADGGVGAQPLWVAPTAAVAHNIASTSGSDDGSPAGVGAQQILLFGLKTWASKETSETVILDGTNNVLTANSYVIIHRMRVTVSGASGPNVGIITATTNDVATTITAQINAGAGQTQMAIYGVPSTQIAYMTQFYADLIDAVSVPSSSNDVQAQVLAAPFPDIEETVFIVKHTTGVTNTATSRNPHEFKPYKPFPGPTIIKVQCLADVDDTDVSAGFDLILVDN